MPRQITRLSERSGAVGARVRPGVRRGALLARRGALLVRWHGWLSTILDVSDREQPPPAEPSEAGLSLA